ncbi:agmatinase [Cyphellophora europaea CBS 101466]|uniref:Agmatinase n=1 Tax=Cyphellophora europaea (strain CBS 101466) TaxID=1220924 RepID=W2RVH1_CYPE1|nr:agmatinase [Cyphellophora europaea CBS 101466]ETN39704.1 agmatinase [Cyphellophora europaea CBS 101466]
MRCLSCLTALLPLTLPHLTYASFYDNPEVPPIPESGTPLDVLKARWDADWAFSGLGSFAHLNVTKCLVDPTRQFDIGIIGAPFDTAVSYRPGARFGPRSIRHASARQTPYRSFNHRAGVNPYVNWASVIDCGDIPVTPFDNALALHQMTSAYTELLSRRALSAGTPRSHTHPKLISLGGDHSIALASLRALAKVHGPVAVLHFDAHLDTWHPGAYPNTWSTNPGSQTDFTHGTMFWLASQEGLIQNSSSVHAGLRTRLGGHDYSDYDVDTAVGFFRIEADDIDALKPEGIAELIMQRIGRDVPCYVSVDIDVLDPGLAPGTGTPEPGGWTTRELIRILRGIEDLNVVGADVVEVAPSYDGRGEETSLAAAQVVYEIVTSIVKRGLRERGEWEDTVKSTPGREWLKKKREGGESVKETVGEWVEEVKQKVVGEEGKDEL